MLINPVSAAIIDYTVERDELIALLISSIPPELSTEAIKKLNAKKDFLSANLRAVLRGELPKFTFIDKYPIEKQEAFNVIDNFRTAKNDGDASCIQFCQVGDNLKSVFANQILPETVAGVVSIYDIPGAADDDLVIDEFGESMFISLSQIPLVLLSEQQKGRVEGPGHNTYTFYTKDRHGLMYRVWTYSYHHEGLRWAIEITGINGTDIFSAIGRRLAVLES